MSLAVLAACVLVIAGLAVVPILAESHLPRWNLGGLSGDPPTGFEEDIHSGLNSTVSDSEASSSRSVPEWPDPDAQEWILAVRSDEAVRMLAEDHGTPGEGNVEDPVILDGGSLLETGLGAFVIENTSLHVQVQGLSLKGSGSGVGLKIMDSQNVSLSQVSIKNFETAVELEHARIVKIDNSTFLSNQRAIHLIGAQDVQLDQNRFSSNKHAVYAKDSETPNRNLSLTRNLIEWTREVPEGSTEDLDAGDSVILTGSNHRVQGNNFTGHVAAALRVRADDVWVEGNQFNQGLSRAVVVKGTKNVTLVENRFEGHLDGALFTLDSQDTLIKGNNFTDHPEGGVQSVNDTAYRVEGNRFTRSGAAIALWSPNQALVQKNSVTGGTHGIRVSNGNEVLIEENTIARVSSGSLALFNGRGLEVAGNTLTGSVEYGVYVRGTRSLLVEANTIQGPGHGVYLTGGTKQAELRGNTLTGKGAVGLRVADAHEVLIRDNEVRLHDFAVLIENEASETRVVGGTLEDNYVGILVSQAQNSATMEGVKGKNNEIGILIEGTGDHELTRLELKDNKVGIQLTQSDSNTITRSVIEHNRVGLFLEASTMNRIYDNMFNNALQSDENVVLEGSPDNQWSIRKTSGPNIVGGPWIAGNWWHDYAGTDANGDGLGETPHEPVPDHSLLGGVYELTGQPMGPFDLRPLVK